MELRKLPLKCFATLFNLHYLSAKALFLSLQFSQQSGFSPERLSTNLADVFKVRWVTAIEHEAYPSHKSWRR